MQERRTLVGVDLTELYFACGGDMDLATLRERAGEVTVLGPARLLGYRLAFFGYDASWDSGIESLVADGQGETWGALYRLRAVEWERLDAFMGATLEGTGRHFHYPVEVATSEGAVVPVRTYRRSVRGDARAPSTEYVSFLLAAARTHALPDAYLAFLQALAAVPARYPVPKRDPSRRTRLHLL